MDGQLRSGLRAMMAIKPLPTSNLFAYFKRYSETLLLVFLFFGCWGFFYTTVSEPASWDSFLYMDLGLNPRPTGYILNRWAHIYLQKLFLDIAPAPLLGAKLYWGFLISATLIFIYLSAKIIRKESNFLNGIAAMLFLGSSALIFQNAGDTLADYTAMFFVILDVLIYLTYFRARPRYQWLLLILYGFILFAALKSKESGLILAVPIVGFGFTNSQFNLIRLLKNAGYIFIGISLGFGTLVLLDYIFIKNALVSLSPNYLSDYSSFVLNSSDLESGVKSRIYYTFVKLFEVVSRFGRSWAERILWKLPIFSSLYLITFSTLIIGLFVKRKRNWCELFVWLMPVAFLVMLIVGQVAARDRHFFPMHPILAILGAQFFNATLPLDIRRVSSKTWTFMKQPKVIATIILFALYAIYKFGPEFERVYYGFGVTVTGIMIILMAVWVKKWRALYSILAVLIVGVYSFYGILFDNVLPLASGQFAAQNEAKARFHPLVETADTFLCSDDTSIYISANIYWDLGFLSRSTSSSPWVFNIFFDCDLTANQTTFANPPSLPSDLTDKLYSYAFLTTAEFNELTPEDQAEFKVTYLLKYIEGGQIVFFSAIHRDN